MERTEPRGAARRAYAGRVTRLTRAVLACTLVAALGGCGADGSPGTPTESRTGTVAFRQVALADAAAAPAVVEASDRFGLAILAGADRSGSLAFSPASAFVALGMLGEGATNAGAAELDTLLGSGGDARSNALNALAGVLAVHEGDPATVDDEDLPDRPLVHVANNVVLDDEAQVAQAFLDRLSEFHDAGVQVTDLATDRGKAVLDAWVREHTGGRIEESGIEPNEDLYLVLQDAILFAARWAQEFDPELTFDATFTTAPGPGQPGTDQTGTEQTGPFMHARWDLAYAEADGWAAIQLPYQVGFVARFVLPPSGTDPADVDPAVLQSLGQALDSAAPSSVEVALPRFAVESRVDLVDALTAQGLSAIFDPRSRPLEGINPDADLHVQQAVQQATITVGEEGTIAAAVTEVGVAGTSAPPPPDHVFIADRPFLMVVQEVTTGWDLFQAVVRSIA